MTNYRDIVLPIIRSTRKITLPHFGNAKIVFKKSESMHDVVTELDREVETYLRDELAKVYPDISFVGEEFGGDMEAKKFWIVDPIDGTNVYTRGIPFCTTMLALIDDGQVIFSAIYDFVNDIMYHAERGKGAYKNDVQIHVSNKSIGDSLTCWETHLSNEKNMEIFRKLRGFTALFKAMCCGYEYALIAEGKMEGRVNFDPWGNEYDYAPGSLLVEEAGGIVRNLGKTTYNFRNLEFIAGNKEYYVKLTSGPDAIFPINEN